MDEPSTQIKSKSLAVASGLVAIIALAWLFYFSDVLVAGPLRENWKEIFGVEWHKDTEWRYLPILAGVMLIPTLALGVIAIWLFVKFYNLNFSTIHHANLKELAKARNALQQSLSSIDTIEREYKGKLDSYERLQKQLEELQSVKEIDTEDLRKKLNAIASASRVSAWFQRVIGFFVGIISSLLAAYLWEILSAV